MKQYSWCIIFGLLIFSCKNSDTASNGWENFEYDYEVLSYHNDTIDDKNFIHAEYYDKNGKIIREAGREEGCTRFFYDKDGHLTERIRGRNCNYGIRELMIYDSSYNLLGTYKTRDSLVNLDTVKYQQTHFYDANNNLVKELSREWNDFKEKKHKQWNIYSYENGKRIKELNIIDENGLEWTGTYEYDSVNNLKSIKKVRKQFFWTKTFKYDHSGRLIEEEIKSNEYPLTPETSFSASNNKTLYRYDSTGQLIEKKILNHKGHVDWKVLYVRKKMN